MFTPRVEPVQLKPYAQKFRTFYNLADATVPAGLRSNSVPLSVGNLSATARATDGALWLGTTQGLMRLDFAAPERDRRQYFAGQRYLPDDHVEQLLADGHGGIWVRTRTGVSHIELKPITLEQKAEAFGQRIRVRHDRYGLVTGSHLAVAGDVNSNQLRDDDNDGLWTAMYAAAECFRYAVTKSPEALANARKSLEAILFLEEVAGRRGFPARSYVRKGDPMPQGGEWHWTKDGQYYWKADTSSDEIVGHFFIFSIAYDLLITRLNEFRKEMNYSDEELAMLPYYCVFQYERDPVLLKAYRSGVNEWWKNIQREANPLWTFIYLTSQPEAEVDLPAAVWSLYRMPIVEWTVRNSHRQDIVWATSPDRFRRREAVTLLPPDEQPVMKWNGNPFVVDGGNGGRDEDDGAAFLLPYWMGRYHGFIIGE